MFKIERKIANNFWYEVMLSPFKNLEEVKKYLNKYSKFYPEQQDRNYRITSINYQSQQ
jgi:hypothetical protein